MIFPLRCRGVSRCIVTRIHHRHIPDLVKLVLILLEHVLVLLRKQLKLFGIQLILNHRAPFVRAIRCRPPVICLSTLPTLGRVVVGHNRSCNPRLVQYALALLHLSREPNLHHVALELPALLELLLQRPYDALSMRLDRVCLGLFNLFLWALCCDCPACCPSSQRAQSLFRPLLQRNLALGCLSRLLCNPQCLDGIVELAY